MATVAEILQDVFEVVSKNTELDPSTPTGQDILLRYVRRAYEYVVTMRTPQSRSLQGLLQVYKPVLISLEPVQGIAQGGSPSSIVLDLTASTNADEYLGWGIQLTGGTGAGQTAIVTAYDGPTQTATVFPSWNTVPDTTTEYILSTRRVPVSATQGPFRVYTPQPRTLQDLVRLVRLHDESRLELHSLPKIDDSARVELGIPSSYHFIPGLLLLDKAPEEYLILEALFRVLPEFPASVSDELPLPAPWEQAVVLNARWWILVRYGEVQDAYAAKRDFFDFVSSLPLPGTETGVWQYTGTRRLY